MSSTEVNGNGRSGEHCGAEKGGAKPTVADDPSLASKKAMPCDTDDVNALEVPLLQQQTNQPACQTDLMSNSTKPVAKSQSANEQSKTKRPICQGCNFHPRTCICPSLPQKPLSSLFKKCRLVVLQHPHELRRKNRSLPLVELCLFGNSGESARREEDFVMKTIVSRRFGDHCDSEVMKILRDPNEVVVLVFPHRHAMNLEDGIRLAEERCRSTTIDKGSNDEGDEGGLKNDMAETQKQKKMTLVFIDATWKLAREMEAATEAAGEWNKNLIQVQIVPSAGDRKGNDSGTNGLDSAGNSHAESVCKTDGSSNQGTTFIERRFHIRTPPSPDHLSTAECLAWIASRVEHDPQIYQSIMKTLDYMVELWQGFTKADGGQKKKGKSMSQKKLKISQS